MVVKRGVMGVVAEQGVACGVGAEIRATEVGDWKGTIGFDGLREL
jgi:hypothetical protein